MNPTGKPMIEWRGVVQSYPCETCGAGPGGPCMTHRGDVKGEPHAPRAALAAAGGWVNPDEGAPAPNLEDA